MSARREKRRVGSGAEKWYWIVDFVFRHPDGRSERVRKLSPVNNKRGAEEFEQQLRKSMLQADGEPDLESNIEAPTFAGFMPEFLESYVRANNKPSEEHTKRMILNHHLVPEFGRAKVDAIQTRDVERYKAKKVAAGYSAKSVNNHLAVLRRMLRVAMEWNLTKCVPLVKPLKVTKPEIRFLTFDESKQLVEASQGKWRNMVAVALNTGLRLGELLALRWKNVDLAAGQLIVCENDWRGIIGTPKSYRRVVPLNTQALEALRRQRHDLGALVFCRDSQGEADLKRNLGVGSRLTYQQCRRPLMRACKAAGLGENAVQWHALRHTFASHMLMRGVPMKAVQELLGHTTMEMTMRYAHLTPDIRKSAVEALDVYVARAS